MIKERKFFLHLTKKTLYARLSFVSTEFKVNSSYSTFINRPILKIKSLKILE